MTDSPQAVQAAARDDCTCEPIKPWSGGETDPKCPLHGEAASAAREEARQEDGREPTADELKVPQWVLHWDAAKGWTVGEVTRTGHLIDRGDTSVLVVPWDALAARPVTPEREGTRVVETSAAKVKKGDRFWNGRGWERILSDPEPFTSEAAGDLVRMELEHSAASGISFSPDEPFLLLATPERVTGTTPDEDREPILCDACNVRPDWPGEHRCCGSRKGDPIEIRCECAAPECRMQRREVTLAELEAEDAPVSPSPDEGTPMPAERRAEYHQRIADASTRHGIDPTIHIGSRDEAASPDEGERC